VARRSGYERRPLVEEFKRNMNGRKKDLYQALNSGTNILI